jgi:hypothetical protein
MLSGGVISTFSGWQHDWDTPASAWWGYAALPGRALTDAEINFTASTYSIVAVSGGGVGVSEQVMNTSARLKAINPALKVLQYFNMQMWAGYSPNDPDFQNFMSHPEWWLVDDNGNVVEHQFGPEYDFSNKEAVANFLAMSLGPNAELIDGFLLDGGSGYDQPPNISSTRAESIKIAKYKAMGAMQQRLTSANGGVALGNGMKGGPIDPHTPEDPYNLDSLNFVNGIENERGTPSFELVDHQTGAFKLDDVAALLEAVEYAGQLANGTKVISMNYWPGPIVNLVEGWPTYASNDVNNTAPSGTRAQRFQGWQALMTKWFPFNLAMFLSVAGDSTYFTQLMWYAFDQGFIPCPDAPGTCAAPTPFYPMMHNKLGKPKGLRIPVAGSKYKWVRTFEHAVVTLDLEDPLGAGTSIVWS